MMRTASRMRASRSFSVTLFARANLRGYDRAGRGRIFGTLRLFRFAHVANVHSPRACINGDTCRIFDWGLSAAATLLRETLPLPSGDDVVVHTWAAPDLPSCNAIAGAVFTTTCTTTALANAVENSGDDVGNDNLLCESSERCLFTPNFGAHQGDGAFVFTGAAINTTINGVLLLRHETNGR